jgi:hypothetical protein
VATEQIEGIPFMWGKIKQSCWTKIIGGSLLLSVGAGFIADGLDDYILVGNSQFVRDHDEGFILIRSSRYD